MKPTLALAVLALLCSCSNKQVYTAIQNNQRFECSKMPQARAEECMRQFDSSYEQYEENLKSAAKERR